MTEFSLTRAAKSTAWCRQRANPQGSQARRDLSRACREVKRVRLAAYDRFLERHVQKLEEDLHRSNQWAIHRRLQSLEPEKTRNVTSPYIRDEDGSLLRDPELILGRWARFLSNLLNGVSDKRDHSIIAGIPLHPIAHVIEVEPTEEEVASALRSMANAKAVGPDELPVELLKLGLHHDATVLREFHRVITRVRRDGHVSTKVIVHELRSIASNEQAPTGNMRAVFALPELIDAGVMHARYLARGIQAWPTCQEIEIGSTSIPCQESHEQRET